MSDFVTHLEKLGAAALAELRRGLSFPPGQHCPSFRFIERQVSYLPQRERDNRYLMAGLFALKERADEEVAASSSHREALDIQSHTLGWSIAHIRDRDGKVSPSTEARFLHLLDANLEELQHPLRQMVSLLRASGVSVDWRQLLKDLDHWNRSNRSVQRRWAQDFYRHSEPQETLPEN